MTSATVANSLNDTFPPPTLPTIARLIETDETWSGAFAFAFRNSIVGRLLGLGQVMDRATPPAGVAVGVDDGGGIGRGSIQSFSQSFGNVLSYMASPWAIMCIFMTIVLNRTTLYASLRRPLRLPFQLRLLLRGLPTFLLFFHARAILYSLRCQTSPNIAPRHSHTELGGFMYWIPRAATFWENDDRRICVAAGMASPSMLGLGEDGKGFHLTGSLELLWPLYVALATSQFAETLACALSGRTPAAETGMTFFEHSVAFAQAEVLSFRNPFIDQKTWAGSGPIPRNVSPEVLYIALISACSHLTSQLLGLFNRQARYRLYSTGFWGTAVLMGFAWALSGTWSGGVAVMRMRSFPTVCVVGFIPHLVIVIGILICFSIYILALLFSSLLPHPFPGHRNNAFWPRPSFVLGFQNLQANITLSNVNLNPSEDFYTALLKLGFLVLTAASEATYLNEGRPIRVPGLTWLEVERLRLLEREKTWQGENLAAAGSLIRPEQLAGKSPYGIERNGFAKEVAQAKAKGRGTRGRGSSGLQWRAAGEIVRGTFVVAARWGILNILRIFRQHTPVAVQSETQEEEVEGNDKPANVPSDDEAPQLIGGENSMLNYGEEEDEASYLYRRFLSGNFPDLDDSDSEYVPEDEEDDSADFDEEVESFDTEENAEFISEPSTSESSSTAISRFSRSPSEDPDPFPTLLSSPRHLADLLDPKSPTQRQNAKILAHHLSSSVPVTRLQHAQRIHEDNRLLYRGILPQLRASQSSCSSNFTSEEAILESVLLDRRNEALSRSRQGSPVPNPGGGSADGGEGGMGPLCVVCQSNPRTILVWPCRCLALCEECRVSLAVNNFGTCVCCRGELAGFSRIYIP